MEQKITDLTSPTLIRHDDRRDQEGNPYQHPVLEPRTLSLQDGLIKFPDIAKAIQKVVTFANGERFPGAVRATWLDASALGRLYPGLNLATVGVLYHVADPMWIPPSELVREFEGEVFVKELDGEAARHHFRTVQLSPSATPTLLLASEFEMLTAYTGQTFPECNDKLIPLIALAGDVLTLGGFYIDPKRFVVTRGVPSGVTAHASPEQLVRKGTATRRLMGQLSPRPWSRGLWPVSRQGKFSWMTMTSFV